METLYEILGVPEDADEQTIKNAYRELAKEHHPDKGGSTELFHVVTFAYSVLSNNTKKIFYDRTGVVQDNNEEDQITLAAESNIICLFEDQVQEHGTDLVYEDVIHNSLIAIDITIESRQKEMREKEIEVMIFSDTFKGRMSCKGDKNLYEQMVKEREQKIEAEISEISLQIKILLKAKELLADYEFKRDEKLIIPKNFPLGNSSW